MEIKNISSMTAAQNFMAHRAALKRMEEEKKNLRNQLAAAICLDAVEQPSRVLRLDTYWRSMGFTPMEVHDMLNEFLKANEDPTLTLQIVHHPIRRHYMEFDENNKPTGSTITRTEEVSFLVNLGEVKPLRNPVEGEEVPEPFMGRESLLDQAPLCKKENCYSRRRGVDCPENPANKWKCYNNNRAIQALMNKVLSQF